MSDPSLISEPFLYEFGPFRLNPSERILLHRDDNVPLSPKTFELLLFLVRRHNQVIDKEALMKEVWQDTFVEDANISVHISKLRKILAAGGTDARIETFPKRGYRFVADVKAAPAKPYSTNGSRNGSSNGAHTGIALLTAAPVETGLSAISATRPQHRTRHPIMILAVVGMVLTGLVIFWFFSRPPTAASPFASAQKLNTTRLATLGKATEMAMSPDGKFAAYVTRDSGNRSIRVRQIASSSDVEIVPPTERSLSKLSFTPDSNHLYYVDGADGECTLQRIPVLGGSPTRIVGNIDVEKIVSTAATVSPDGKTIAFQREDETSRTSFLQLASADGTQEQTIAAWSNPERLHATMDWSPDATSIAFAVSRKESDGLLMNLFRIDPKTGTKQQLSESSWSDITGIEWLVDGSLLVAGKERSNQRFEPSQIWFIAPGTAPRAITSDPFGYLGMSLNAQGDTLLTKQVRVLKNVWIVPENDASRAYAVTTAGEVTGGISWTPDGNLILGSNISGNPDIWTLNADGTNRKQLTSGQGTNTFGSMTADGRYIVFHSNRVNSVQHIFRMNADGSNQIQLTHGHREFHPGLSNDGKWIFYAENVPDSQVVKISKISIDGGTPTEIARSFGTIGIDISPVNGLLAYTNAEQKVNGGNPQVVIISPDGGEPIQTLSLPRTANLAFFQWTPDGRAIAFNDSRNNGADIWALAIDGKTEARPLTSFTSDTTLNFDWSADGKKLVASRGAGTTDFLLINPAKR